MLRGPTRNLGLALGVLVCVWSGALPRAEAQPAAVRSSEVRAGGAPDRVTAFDADQVDLDSLPLAFRREVPGGLDDLLAIERQIQKISEAVLPATVSVRIGRAQGSGVIVTRDGYVLTAAHVIGGPGRDADLTLPDGRKVEGRTLGVNRGLDAGLIKISEPGPWPTVELGDLDQVEIGDWCLATGHPGGYQAGRPPVLRWGRVILESRSAVQTDCTLVGGDSGGPLFDMRGRVIGINSRIGRSTTWNFHVPITAYAADWDKLVAGRDWGGSPPAGSAFLGLSGDDHPDGCKVTGVGEGLPAEKAGIRNGDVILKFDGRAIENFDGLAAAVRARKPGDSVEIELRRDGERLTVTVELARRGDATSKREELEQVAKVQFQNGVRHPSRLQNSGVSTSAGSQSPF
jgi:serine protease Do